VKVTEATKRNWQKLKLLAERFLRVAGNERNSESIDAIENVSQPLNVTPVTM
jgi:hypothetical protein